MRRTKEIMMLVVTLVLCGLLFAERLTGDIWHAVIGVLLIVALTVHICRQSAKIKYQKNGARIVDQVLIGAMIVLFATGMLLHPLQNVLILKILHKLSAVVFVLGIIGHVLQHRTSFFKNSKKEQK